MPRITYKELPASHPLFNGKWRRTTTTFPVQLAPRFGGGPF